VLYRLPPNVADGSTGWQSAVPLDAPGSEYDFSEWLPSETLLRSGELWKWYFRASYFSISTLTGLGKDLLPLDDVATLFTILVFVVGVLVFAYITSSIVTLVNQADISSRTYKTQKIQLLGYMNEAHIDAEVIQRAAVWYDHWWHSHGAAKIDHVLSSLTPTLSHRVRKAVVEIAVEGSALFARDAEGEQPLPAAFLEAFTRAVTFEVFNSGEWVMHKGMLTAALSVIAQGSAQVLIDEASSIIIAQLGVGDCYGPPRPAPFSLLPLRAIK